MRDLRDPSAIGKLLLSTPTPASLGESICTRADNLPLLEIRDYQHDETSQSAAQRAYREKHVHLAAQGVRASEEMLAYLDGPKESQAHPGSLVADVDTRPHVNGHDQHPVAGIDSNGDLSA